MKKLLILYVLFLGCSMSPDKSKKVPYSTNNTNPSFPVQKDVKSQKGFSVSKGFIKADDKTVLELLIGSSLLLNMSAEEQLEAVIRLKDNTEVYVKENSLNNEENIMINKSELGPSKQLLEVFTSQFKDLSSSMLIEGVEMRLINSGFGNYQNRFEYVFFNSLFKTAELERYSYQYFISVNKENFHIVINTKEGLEIQDVFMDIN